MKLNAPSVVRRVLADASLGVLVLPTLAVAGAPAYSTLSYEALAAGIGVAAVVVAYRLHRPGVRAALLGFVMVVLMAWALAYSTYSLAGPIAAGALGAGLGLTYSESLRRTTLLSAALFAVLLAALRWLAGRDAALAVGVIEVGVATIACVAASLRGSRIESAEPAAGDQRWAVSIGRREFLETALGAGALVSFAYLGATNPDADWFGPLITNRPNQDNLLSITFDDGPNIGYTLKVKEILDSYGVKGTFFTVGKALAARPDISRALLDGGHLLGDHSFSHDYYAWLNPRYPELRKAQNEFEAQLGVRPAFYRPPHGTRSPFVNRVVSDSKMRSIGWSVDAGDWDATDGKLVAQRILAGTSSGSIILLHDGVDGNLTADRSVLLEALPLILEGLKTRGLKPVGLDELLGTRAYLT